MKKAGRVVLVIVLAAVLLGAVCVGVGLMPGADTARIYSALDNRYNIGAYLENYTVWAEQVIGALTEAWQGPAA